MYVFYISRTYVTSANCKGVNLTIILSEIVKLPHGNMQVHRLCICLRTVNSIHGGSNLSDKIHTN